MKRILAASALLALAIHAVATGKRNRGRIQAAPQTTDATPCSVNDPPAGPAPAHLPRCVHGNAIGIEGEGPLSIQWTCLTCVTEQIHYADRYHAADNG